MQVGLINMNPTKKPEAFVETLQSLQCNVQLVDATELPSSTVLETIRSSSIQKWIFTGSSFHIYDKDAPTISMELLDLPDKEYFFICYSMEYVLHQLGYPVLRRKKNKKETFLFSHPTHYMKSPASLYRNHHYYIPAETIRHTGQYEGETMIVFYKQACMTQFHPEKTEDGKQMLFVWLHQTAKPVK